MMAGCMWHAHAQATESIGACHDVLTQRLQDKQGQPTSSLSLSNRNIPSTGRKGPVLCAHKEDGEGRPEADWAAPARPFEPQLLISGLPPNVSPGRPARLQEGAGRAPLGRPAAPLPCQRGGCRQAG